MPQIATMLSVSKSTIRRRSRKFGISINQSYSNLTDDQLGDNYMIPTCQDEISARPTGTDFTLRLHVEIKFRPGKAVLV